MAKKQSRRTAFDDVGDQVSDLMQTGQERIRQSSRSGQGVPGHAGEEGVDNRGLAKMSLYLSPPHQKFIRELGEQHDVVLGSVVEFALDILKEMIEKEMIDPAGFKEGPIKSTKASWRLVKSENRKFFE